MKNALTIHCAYDPDVKVWYVAATDVPGLATEADTMDALEKRIQAVVPELLALNAHLFTQGTIPPIITHFERPLILAA
jgi:Domain of unknown function (DUF1902)